MGMKVRGREGMLVCVTNPPFPSGAADLWKASLTAEWRKSLVSVGLDDHQAFVQVCVMDADGNILKNRRCASTVAAVRQAVDVLVPQGTTVQAAVEAGNGAADFAEELVAAGWQVSLAHATYVHKLKQSPDKTDWSDARMLEDLTQHDPFVKHLRTHRGVGLITAVTLRAEWGTMARFRSGKQLARFCARSPRNASSGKKQAGAGVIQAGNRERRRVLIETSHRLMRCDARWQTLGQSLKVRGKKTSVAAVAGANRWVRWLSHQWKSLGV